MLADSLYKCSPILIQSAFLSVYGGYLQWLRYGKGFHSSLEEIARLESISAEEITRFQTSELKRVATSALMSVPYYRRRYPHPERVIQSMSTKTLSELLPVLEKSVVRAFAGEFVSSEVAQRKVIINTSGSTGSPLAVVTTRSAISRNYAFFERFLNSHGVSYRDKSATFAGRMIVPSHQKHPPFWRYNAVQNTWLMSSYNLSDSTCEAYIKFLSKLSPTYIDSYPSAIVSVARFINKHHVQHAIRPKVIVTSSESLTAESRNELERAFSCEVADQYGNAEMAGFIAQCQEGSYHVNPLYGLVEVVNEEGHPVPLDTPGNLVLTGFVNDSMPLLRYSIGDSAILSSSRCRCGSAFPLIRELLGRTDDLIVLEDGRKIGRLDPLFKGLEGIDEAQIVQKSLNQIDVNVVYTKNCGDKLRISAALAESIRDRLRADVQISVQEVNGIAKSANGKFKSVVSLVGR